MEINPDVLEFKAPLSESSAQPLHLTNTSKQAMAYKIKTTAPKLYCVRPNASVIGPGEKVEVSIVRQGKEANPDSKHKDKFLVLSAPVSDPEATANFAELWSDIETNHEDTIVNKKIRVHYDTTPEQQPSAQEKQQEQQPPAYSAAEEGSNGHQTESLAGAAATLGVGAGAAATAQNADFVTPSKQSDREIDEAKQKISAMSEEMKSTSSETEKPAVSSSEKQSSSSAAAGATQPRPVQPANSGIPIPVVLLVALFSFLIGWKLF